MELKIEKKISISQKGLLFFALLLPFFPPMSINLLVEQIHPAWKILDYTLDAAKLITAAVILVVWLYNRRGKTPLWFLLLLCHVACFAVCCLFNGSVSISVLRIFFADAAFCLLAYELLQNSQRTFLRAGMAVFGLLAVWGTVTVYLFPNGFFGSDSVYEAIFGLGAKNNAFPYFFAFVFFLILWQLEREGQVRLWTLIPLGIMALAGIICQSASTTLCLGATAAVVILASCMPGFMKRLNIMVLLGLFVAGIVMIYAGTQSELISTILESMGRSASFSGRDGLWEQALQHLRENPLFGRGFEIEFEISATKLTPHAHSQWMDKLAKYGLIPAVFLVGVLWQTFRRLHTHPNRYQAMVMGLLLMVYMLHMSFDTYNYNFFTMFLVVVNHILWNSLGLGQSHQAVPDPIG